MQKKWKRKRPDQLTVRGLRTRITVLAAKLEKLMALEADWTVFGEARKAAEADLGFATSQARLREQELAGLAHILADRNNFRAFAFRNAPSDAAKLPRHLLNGRGEATYDAVRSRARRGWQELEDAVQRRTLEHLGPEYVAGERLVPPEPSWDDKYYVRSQLADYMKALDVKLASEAPRIQREEALRSTKAAYEGRARKAATTVRRNLKPTEKCPYCGKKLGSAGHADHIYPLSRGGMSTTSNMVFICRACNIAKGNKTLREFIIKSGLNRVEVEKRLEKLGKTF